MEVLKEYIDSGYVLTELKDGYAFLGKPEEARQLDYYKRADVKFNAVVNPQGKIITDFIYHCDFKTIEEFNSNKGESFFPVCKSDQYGNHNYYVINSQGKEIVAEKYYSIDCSMLISSTIFLLWSRLYLLLKISILSAIALDAHTSFSAALVTPACLIKSYR